IFQRERDFATAYWEKKSGLAEFWDWVDASGLSLLLHVFAKEIFYLVWDGSSYQIPAQQLEWAQKSLASAVAQSAKLRVVMGHLPLYPVSAPRDKFGEILQPAEDLRALLEQYQVHLYISGHHHAYFPGHRGQLKLLFSGALGSGPRQLLGTDLPPQHTLTVVDVDLQAAETRYTTYDMNTWQVIDPKTFPEKIVGSTGWVMRDDIQDVGMGF
ncbi:MAG: metallophosphoesterase, partial [Oscillatoriales cyanobacterium RM2_1_1]|nr:metallophosphoesterase [Oscillatoriales cyanobacterium RM2_1_1]